MKYTFEASETEVTEMYGLLGLIAKEIGKTVRHANELRARPMSGEGRTVSAVVPVQGDSEDSDADVLPFRRPTEVPRSGEQEFDDGTVYETEPAPKVAPANSAEAEVKRRKTLALGRERFDSFIAAWMVGIDYESLGLVEGVVQPNRELLLRELCNSPYAHPVLEFIRECGGLQRAIFEVTDSKHLGRRLPDFIVPPASIVFSDLSDTYEYTNPWKDED
jgi:hypothetical protein